MYMKCSIIIILYNSDAKFVMNNIKAIYHSVDEIILVDNSDDVNKVFSSISDNKVTYIPNLSNLGIAAAQNIGIKKARELKSDFVVLFDQDSLLIDYDFSSMIKVYSQFDGDLACIGPRIIDSFSNKKVRPLVQKEIQSIQNLTLCSQIIASGKMIKMSVLDKIGLFEEQLFIDGVDHEWCWRAASKGFVLGINEDVVMTHTLGDARYNFGGVTFKVASPIRTYYQFRNILILSRRGYVPIYWKFRNILSIPIRFIVFSLFHKDKDKYRKFMISGFRDGLLKCSGKYK